MSGLRTVSGKLPYSGSNFTVVPSILNVDGVTWNTFRLVTQATNLITNPAGRTTSGTVTARTNICTNPSFETNTSSWASIDNYPIAQYGSDSVTGTKSASFGATGMYCAGNSTAASTSHTASIYVKNTVAGAKGNVWVVESPAPASTIGNMRYALAKNGPGYLSEESTTNLWMNPGMEANINGYSVLSGGATLSRDTTTYYSGTASLKVVRATTADFRLVRLSYSMADGMAVFLNPGNYTMHCWVKGNAGQTSNQVAPQFESQPASSSGYATGTITSTTYAALNGTWQRAITTFNVTNAGTAVLNINTYLNGATNTGAVGDTFWVDNIQLEAKNYASSYVDGSLGTGYVWDTTTNLVSNPSFETNTTGWAPADFAQGAVARNTGSWFSGTASLTTPSGAYTTLTSVAGSTYTSTCWVRTNSSAAGTTAQLFHTKSPATSSTSGPGLRYVKAQNGPGALIEELTTNLCLNPNVVGTSWIYNAGAGVTITADATQAYIGAGSAKVVCDGTVSQQGVQFTASEQGPGTYTGSIWVKGPAGATVFAQMRYSAIGTAVADTVGSNVTLTGGWQRITAPAITAPASAVAASNIYVMIRTTSPQAITFWADNGQIEARGYATTYLDGSLGTAYGWDGTTNLISNPSFETNTTGWTGSAATISQDTTQHFSGTAALKVSASGTQSYSTASFGSGSRMAVSANGWYTLSAYFKSEVTSRGAFLKIYWYDSGGTLITSISSTGSAPTSTTAWVRMLFTAQAPSNAASCYIDCFVSAGTTIPANENYWVDAVQLESRAYATPYGNTGAANTTSSSRGAGMIKYTISPLTMASGVSAAFTAVLGFNDSRALNATWLSLENAASGIVMRTLRHNFKLGVGVVGGTENGVAQVFNTGDVLKAVMTYTAGTSTLYYTINGGAVQTITATGTASVATIDTINVASQANSGQESDCPTENVMVFSSTIDATTAGNMVNGNTLPSSMAARADCVFSAFVNDPRPPWVGAVSSGGYGRLFHTRTTAPGETRTDLVVLSTGADSVNQLYIDAVQTESRSYATPFGNAGAANTVSSTRSATSSLTWTTPNVSSTATLLVGVKINDAMRQRASLSQYPAIVRLWDGANQIVLQIGPTGNVYGQKNIGGTPYAPTHSPAQNVNSGDYVMAAVTVDASGNVTSNVSINGAAVNSATYTGNTGTLINANTLYALGGITENIMVFNTVLSGTTLTNILTGVTLPSAAAARSDCIYSAFTNDPQTMTALAPSIWTRVSTTAKASPRQTRSDFVFLTDSPGGASTPSLVDANLVERGTALLSYFDGDHRAHLRENLVINPSAEALSTGWGAYPGTGGAATFTRNTDGGYSGAAYMRYTWTTSPTATNGGVYSMGNPVVAGTTYTGSMYVRSSVAQKVVLTFEWKLPTGGNVSTTGGSVVTLAPNTWTRLSNTATAPTGAVSTTMTAYVTTGGAIWNPGDWMDGDAAMLEASSTLNPYFDGDQPGSAWLGATGNSISYTYDPEFSAAWTGTANTSTSITRATGINRWTHTTGSNQNTVVYQHTEAGSTFTRFLIPGGSEAAAWRIALIGNSDDFSSIVAGDVVTLIMRARVGGALSTWTTNNVTICQGSTAGGIGAQFTPTPVLTTAWQEFRATATAVNAPSGAVVLYYSMPGTAFSADAWMDIAHVAVIRGNFPGPYFDGSGPYTPEPDYIYSWSGAADASTSIATP